MGLADEIVARCDGLACPVLTVTPAGFLIIVAEVLLLVLLLPAIGLMSVVRGVSVRGLDSGLAGLTVDLETLGADTVGLDEEPLDRDILAELLRIGVITVLCRSAAEGTEGADFEPSLEIVTPRRDDAATLELGLERLLRIGVTTVLR